MSLNLDWITLNGSGETSVSKLGVGTTEPSHELDVVGNANVSGTVSATSLTGTLSTAAQPNITSVGTLSSLEVLGRITAENSVIYSKTYYVNDGGKTLQAGIDEMGSDQAAILNVSSGSYADSDVLVHDKINIGIEAPIPGNMYITEIGSSSSARTLTISGTNSTRVRMTGFQVKGKTTISGTQGRHYFHRMNFAGGLEFTGTTGNWIVFNQCDFDGGVTIPNTFGGIIYFVQCAFAGSVISCSSASAQQAILMNCSGLPSLTLTTVTYLGQCLKQDGTSILVNPGSLISGSLTGTLSTAAQPNITSVGTLSSLNVGNVTSSGTVSASTLSTTGPVIANSVSVNGLDPAIDSSLNFDPSIGSLQLTHAVGGIPPTVEITSDNGNILLNPDVSGSSFPSSVTITGDIDYTGTLKQNGVAVSFGGGSSQWTTSGSNIYYSSGNVGIGSTEMRLYNGSAWETVPSKLGVYMNSGAAENPARGRGLFVVSNGNSTATDQIVFQAAAADAQPGFEGLVVDGRSYVGIGTVSPGYPLTVAGSGYVQADIRSTSATQPGHLTIRSNTTPVSVIQLRTAWSGGNEVAGIIATGDGGSLRNLKINEYTTFRSNGFVGIGSDTPFVPLYIGGSVTHQLTTGDADGYWSIFGDWFADYRAGVQSSTVGDGPRPYSCIAERGFGGEFYVAWSDARIKDNIALINDGDALQKLREIEPKEYTYKDVLNKGYKKVYGFIAQEVREKFPEAVTLTESFIPSVYKAVTVTLPNILHYRDADAQVGMMYRIYAHGCIKDVVITGLTETTMEFSTSEPLTAENLMENQVLLFGRKVTDFHALDKNYLFTINFAATQELDRRNQELEARNQELTLKVTSLESQLHSLRNALIDKGVIE